MSDMTPPAGLAIPEITPATLQKHITALLERIAAERLPLLCGVMRVRGMLTDLGKASGSMFYGASLTADGTSTKIDVAATLLASHGIERGQNVIATGCVSIKSGKFGVEVRLGVTEIELAKGEEATISADTDRGRMTIEGICALDVHRNPFPDTVPLKIALIHSASSLTVVAQDFMAEINKLGDKADVRTGGVNMSDAVAIATLIRKVGEQYVLVLIRGGGDAADFEVFNDRRVVEALAQSRCHRIVGLGHSNNSSLLDLVSDFSARTPGQAGIYIREQIERRERLLGDSAKEIRIAKERIEGLEKERNTAHQQAKVATELAEKVQAQAKSGVPLWAVAAAFIAGAILVMLVR